MKKLNLFIILSIILSVFFVSCDTMGMVGPCFACIKLVDENNEFVYDADFSVTIDDISLDDLRVELNEISKEQESDWIDQVCSEGVLYFLTSTTYSKILSNPAWMKNHKFYDENTYITISKEGYKTNTVTPLSSEVQCFDSKHPSFLWVIIQIEKE